MWYILIASELNILQQITANLLEHKKMIQSYFCTTLIDVLFNGNNLLDYTNLFSPNKYEKSGKIIIRYFQ